MSSKDAVVMCNGDIDKEMINNTHRQIKTIIESYKNVNLKVNRITSDIKENWVGLGATEFESQYKLLISKIEDFGDTLDELYDALVNAEFKYEEADDEIRQKYVMSMQE